MTGPHSEQVKNSRYHRVLTGLLCKLIYTYRRWKECAPINTVLHKRYRTLVGSLMHAAVTCRPDMAFSVGTLSRHLQHPSQIHVDAAERVFKYLRYTADLSLCYGRLRSAHTFYSTCDASHAAVNFRGVTGWHFNFCGGAISWKRSLQKLISHSSTESELIALDEAAREPVYLQKLLKDFRVNVELPILSDKTTNQRSS